MLSAGPVTIAESTAGLTGKRSRTAPPFGGWSLNDVLAHLRSCADVWGGCIAAILAEERPMIRAVNPRHWIATTDYPEQAFDASLEAFTRQRKGLMRTLRRLQPQDWSRSATIVGAGRPLERSVHYYAGWLAVHERAHLKQVRRIADSLRTE